MKQNHQCNNVPVRVNPVLTATIVNTTSMTVLVLYVKTMVSVTTKRMTSVVLAQWVIPANFVNGIIPIGEFEEEEEAVHKSMTDSTTAFTAASTTCSTTTSSPPPPPPPPPD